MNKGYVAYKLKHDGSATPALHTDQSAGYPGLNQASDCDTDTLILRSGFSTIIKDTSCHLSPALQLNGDLGLLDKETLRAFAEAELQRKNNAVYSTYSVEPQARVCVVSKSGEELSSFIDTYGGVLTIEPLLLSGSHPELGTVTELTVSYHSDSYTINYSVRSPIDYSKCTYCGKCSPACPESCISETLYFDFHRCTFCRDCEKACPENAVDIYAIEQRSLTVPAIIILGNADIDLPEERNLIFSRETLPDYFSSLYPYQVDEVITCNQAVCQYSPRTRSGCTLCKDGCSFGAISAADGIAIDARKCVECGFCAGVCPTGAIQYRRFDDESFFEFFRTFPLPNDAVVVIGDEDGLHRLWWNNRDNSYHGAIFIEYPNIQALSPVHLLFLIAHGASHVLILNDRHERKQSLSSTLSEVNNLLEAILSPGIRVKLSPVDDFAETWTTLEKTSCLQNRYTSLSCINRREKLASITRFLLEQSPKPVVLKNTAGSLFSAIECNEQACTQCLACLNECNIQALTADPTALSLSWNGSLCTGCNGCVAVCPENALSAGESVSLSAEYFQPSLFAQAEPIRCKECGKVFGTKKSFERVMQILAKRNLDHQGHFEYCEDCRVIKLMDEE